MSGQAMWDLGLQCMMPQGGMGEVFCIIFKIEGEDMESEERGWRGRQASVGSGEHTQLLTRDKDLYT